MSRYADFACLDRKIYVFLGKTIFRKDGSVNYFHIGEAEEPLNIGGSRRGDTSEEEYLRG